MVISPTAGSCDFFLENDDFALSSANEFLAGAAGCGCLFIGGHNVILMKIGAERVSGKEEGSAYTDPRLLSSLVFC